MDRKSNVSYPKKFVTPTEKELKELARGDGFPPLKPNQYLADRSFLEQIEERVENGDLPLDVLTQKIYPLIEKNML